MSDSVEDRIGWKKFELELFSVAALFFHVYAAIAVLGITLVSWANQNGSEIIRAGAVGEDIAMRVLGELPDSYTVFNQVDIPNEKSRAGFNEADIIVLGPKAIFVVEVKHNNGTISGEENDKEWHVQKVGRGGTGYSKMMRNPISQVKKLTWLLSQEMKKDGSRAWVQGVVLFSNSDASVQVEDSGNVPVLSLSQVNQYILNFETKSRPSNYSRITRALASLKAA